MDLKKIPFWGQDNLANSANDLIAMGEADLPDQTREHMELCEMKGGDAN